MGDAGTEEHQRSEQEDTEQEAEEAFPQGRRCYVGNLAWRTSWQDLKDHFRSAGNVVYANVTQDQSGRSRGWGIVEYETTEEVRRALPRGASGGCQINISLRVVSASTPTLLRRQQRHVQVFA